MQASRLGGMTEKVFHRYASLDEALEDKRIPLENRPMIRAFVVAIGCARFERTTSYLKAGRRDGGPHLQIAYGWSSGFVSREEAEAAAGIEPWARERKGLFCVTHPVHKGHRGGGVSYEAATSGRICPSCNCEIPLAETVCPDCFG